MRLCYALLLVPLLASAQEPAASGPAATGAQTAQWLELQKSGTQAEGEARPMTGDVADAVYQRYLESFKHPIPESLSSSDDGSASSSGSTASTASGSSR